MEAHSEHTRSIRADALQHSLAGKPPAHSLGIDLGRNANASHTAASAEASRAASGTQRCC